jgi:hypothetical protein
VTGQLQSIDAVIQISHKTSSKELEEHEVKTQYIVDSPSLPCDIYVQAGMSSAELRTIVSATMVARISLRQGCHKANGYLHPTKGFVKPL